MADFVYDDTPVDDPRGATTRRFVNLAGAAVSTALVIGMGVWGYKLMVRDVTGIPVIEAIDGAFRTQPEDPGGMQTPHQGLQVNEIAGGGTASDAAEEVTLAPEPQSLASEDVPTGDLPTVETQDTPTEEVASIPDPVIAAPEEVAPNAAEPPRDEVAPLSDTPPENDSQATDLAVAEAMAALGGDGDAPAVDPEIATPRPAPRPGDVPAEVAPADLGTAGAIGAGEVEVDVLPEGTRLVQLGAFESAQVAREHWRDVGARFSGAFADKRMIVQEATSGGQAFYRLRAEGFASRADAQDFCSALLAGQADCIPVEVR